MARADYAHWNEEQDRVWWEEEGRHVETADDHYDPDDYMPSQDAADAYAEELAEKTNDQLHDLLADADYLARWPKAEALIRWELENGDRP